jgi:trehalose 6-phosphate phosphatase
VDHPNVVEDRNFDRLSELAEGKLVALFMDYDGTLTPIVNNPDEAFLSEDTRAAVRELAKLFPTAIISGRGREKVEEFVQLDELYYAGSHGMDIAAPKLNDSLPEGKPSVDFSFQPAAQYESLIQDVRARLTKVTSQIEGSSIEDNKYCISVHFRNCHPDSYEEILKAVDDIVAQEPDLHVTRGRKVLEVRPKVNWDKGSALIHLVSMLGIKEDEVFCLYIGDDRTDEDAFRVLLDKQMGAGILVSNRVKPTKSIFTVRDPQEVSHLLERLIEFGRSQANLWHSRRECKGWTISDAL